MWCLSEYGFFSVVCARDQTGRGFGIDESRVMVRSRVRSHLENLLTQFPQLTGTPILDSAGTDYRFRIVVDKPVWAAVIHDMALGITYGNFKSRLAQVPAGTPALVSAAHRIWSILADLQDAVEDNTELNDLPLAMESSDTLRGLLRAVIAGDCAGIPSEFVPQSAIPKLYRKLRPQGWPFAAVGGGPFHFPPETPSDDGAMARCLVQSYENCRGFDPSDAAAEFVRWLDSNPPDVGGTIRRVLSASKRSGDWFMAACAEFDRNPENAANGALMRNGVMAGVTADARELARITLLQTIITHFNPLCVACSAVHSWLIRELLAGRRPLDGADWLDRVEAWLQSFTMTTDDLDVNEWRDQVGAGGIAKAFETLRSEQIGSPDFDPFRTDFTARAGYVVLTLQIAVWALRWSYLNPKAHPFPVPTGFPAAVFARRGGDTIGWVALIGNDADTYGAVAAPLLWAAHGNLPERLTPRIVRG